MSEKDIKRLLNEVRQSLERSQRTLGALEERQAAGRPSTPPPPAPSAPSAPSAPTPTKGSISYVRRKTASYDSAFLSQSKPEGDPDSSATDRAAMVPSRPTPTPTPGPTSALHTPPMPPPPSSGRVPPEEGRYMFIEPREPKKAR